MTGIWESFRTPLIGIRVHCRRHLKETWESLRATPGRDLGAALRSIWQLSRLCLGSIWQLSEIHSGLGSGNYSEPHLIWIWTPSGLHLTGISTLLLFYILASHHPCPVRACTCGRWRSPQAGGLCSSLQASPEGPDGEALKLVPRVETV